MTEHYEDLIGPVANFLLGEPNRAMSSKTELRYGNHGSLSIDLTKGTWFDHESQKGGGLFDFVAYQTHCEARESPQWLEEHNFHLPENDGPSKHNGSAQHRKSNIAAIYQYEDGDGTPLFEVVRFEPKDFRQRRPDGRGGYIWSVRGVPIVPYHLPELREAEEGHRVYIVEGEKDADILRERCKVKATCNAGGVGKWRPELCKYFEDLNVVIIPDNDPQKTHPKTGELMVHPDGRPIRPGQDHANEIAESLLKIARSVKVLNLAKHWPQMPLKGDVYDWLTRCEGAGVERLNDLVDETSLWSPELAEEPVQFALIPLERPFPIIESDIPPRAWVIPGLLSRKHVTVLVAPSGAGKSLLTLQLGIASALNKKWAGWEPRKHFRVLFINSEDDYDEMRRRLAAACRIGITQADQQRLHENFMIAADLVANTLTKKTNGDKIRNGAVIAEFDPRKKSMIITPRFHQLIQTIRDNKIDVIFVDPFAETFDGDENSNNELKSVGAIWREIARMTDTAVCLVHHTRKYATGMAGDVDAARGAGALIGVARIVSTLFPMTVREAEVMLTDEDEPKERNGAKLDVQSKRMHYLRYDDAKANLNVISAHAKWFRKSTIRLENERAAEGDEPRIEGDEVGVLIPWKGKNPNLLDDQIRKFFEAVDRGIMQAGKPTGEFYTAESRGRDNKRYIVPFAQKFFKEQGSPMSLKKIEELIDGWFNNNPPRLREIEYHSSKSRKTKLRVISELSENPEDTKSPPEEQNGELDFQQAQVIPFKQRGMKEQEPTFVAAPASSQFQFLGTEDGPCIYCGSRDGFVYLVRDPFRAVAAQPLHEHCAAAYFKRDK